mgnify:CR=1 FL=1
MLLQVLLVEDGFGVEEDGFVFELVVLIIFLLVRTDVLDPGGGKNVRVLAIDFLVGHTHDFIRCQVIILILRRYLLAAQFTL